MKRITKFASLLALAGMLGGAAVDVDAAVSQNVNTHAATCNPFNASQATLIDYFTSGVRTLAGFATPVVCAVERHPVTGPSQNFFVDGSNFGGQSTSCTLTSFTFTGTFESSTSFTSNLAIYDVFQTLTSVGFFSYVSLLCTLPASGQGVLRGVTALDN